MGGCDVFFDIVETILLTKTATKEINFQDGILNITGTRSKSLLKSSEEFYFLLPCLEVRCHARLLQNLASYFKDIYIWIEIEK